MDKTTKAVELYDEIAKEYAQKIETRIPQKQLELFSKHVPKGSHILDAGCAAGRDSRELSARGYQVTGIDLSKNLLAIAKQENPTISFVLGDIRDLPFQDNAFDAIWALAVIHHLGKEEVDKALKEFYRVLKNGGIIFLKTKRGEGILRTSEELSSQREREFTLITSKELNDMLTKVGFKKKELTESKSHDREVFWVEALYQK